MSKELSIKDLYPFQYYTISNVNLLETANFKWDNYSFNLEHTHEFYIGNINGLVCRNSFGFTSKIKNYLLDRTKLRKLTFLLPENYRESINNYIGFRQSVLDVLDNPLYKDQLIIKTYKVDNSDIIEKIKEMDMGKFDITIMNPPYSGDLHINILKEVLQHSKTIVNISPNPFFNYRKNTGLRPNEIIEYSYDDSCAVFGGIQLQCPLAITVYNNSDIYANITKYTPKLYTILCQKVKKELTFKDVNVLDYSGTGIFVPLKLMTATWDKNKNIIVDKLGVLNNGYTLDNTYYKNKRNRNKNRLCGGIYFSTLNEAKNFYDSCNTTFYKVYVKMFHVASRYVLKDYPFMQDYSQPWTNKRFCDYYNLTGYISDTQAVPNSDWDLILKENI